ncbi:hypothetical protein PDIG_61100 [Penicillium digitatum PHI26]|uniref:Uncharacterized protein n=3 Tax=Penicillium digitatum TaxID=36651 RepID=K9FJ07_PEND2|nr:hypothetical protein PDIP_70530 [Penicillium digitatum Pd1]EKV08090.1 hypothetical protein PDIP_70530 [Penicillium digitatum Pd1]EKV09500.1 hypothetical protein PDIG_61100 [Penicillium digitatum PHI26]
MRHDAPKRNAMANRVSLNGPSDLLGLLAPSHLIQTKDTATDATRAGESTTNDPSYSNLKRDVDKLIADCRAQGAQSSSELDDHGQPYTVRTGDNLQSSKKRYHGSTDASPQAAHDEDLDLQGRHSSNQSPAKKRQRTDAGEMPVDPTEFEQVQNKPVPSLPSVHVIGTKSDNFSPSSTNPWEGMTKIPLSEVEIPRDQAELLEGLKWIPQDPGVSAPLCHVPPHLLTRWNYTAQKRQTLAEEQQEEVDQVSERAFTPTQQELYTYSIPWSLSPDRTPARDVLPRDTASPPSYIRPTGENSMPNSTRPSVDQSAEYDNVVSVVNLSCSAPSQSRQDDIDWSEDGVNTADHQRPLSPEEVTAKQRHSISLDHGPGDDPFPKHNGSKSLDVVKVHPPSTLQEHHSEEPSAENAPLKFKPCDESSSDESDGPEMETFVPFALGGSVPLSSQPEPELTSSGPLLPRFAGATIQVIETPVVRATYLNTEKNSKQRAGFQAPSSQQPSSQAPKTSPSSRILNTYRSQESQGHSDLSQEAPSLPLPVLEDESLGVDVLSTQTQTSSVHAPSQATVQSSSDIVLDSSRPAQRQRGSSIFHLDPSDDPSSFPHASCHSLPTSQPHEPSLDSSRGPFSLDGASQLPELSPTELTTWVAAHGESPCKYPRSPRCKNADASQKSSHSANAELVARRQGFIGKSDKYAEAQKIYEKFCNDYSPYSGDFSHFTEMCSRLQKMRQRDQLQRSFLWDDFVIQHLEEYSRYFEERASQESKPLGYEDFFCSKFSRPQHKRRSLTAHGVDIVASQFVPPTSTKLGNAQVLHQVTSPGEVTRDKATQREVANTSFTASLVDKLSNLHAHSFGDDPVPDVHMPTVTQSSPSSSASTSPDSLELKIEPDGSFNGMMGSQIITSSNDQKPVFSSFDEELIDTTQYDADNIHIAPDLNDIEMAETGMDEIDETQERDDTHHETASIELGDETDDHHISASPAPPGPLGSLNVAEPERPRQRRPWFRSLRKMFPTGPVWSDDPDTPFKRWARQDQNVLQELKRRGGARVLTDEKGVIRWPTYNQEKNSDL